MAMDSVDARSVGAMGRVYAEPYKSARGLALILTILFCVYILITVIAVALDLVLIDLLSGGYVNSGDMQLNDNVQLAVRPIQAVAFIVTAVFFLVWIHRVHRNLPWLGTRGLKYSPAWAIGGFFIPFVNLVLPFLVVREIWKASDPQRTDGHSWKDTSLSLVVPSWWILFCVAEIGPLVVNIALGGGNEVAARQNLNWVLVVSDVLDLPATILAILVVRGIVSRQDKKYSNLVSAAPIVA
jgi:hypothetical protein